MRGLPILQLYWIRLIDIFLLEVSPLAFGFHSPIVIDAVINRAKFLKVIQISQLNITQTNYSFSCLIDSEFQEPLTYSNSLF